VGHRDADHLAGLVAAGEEGLAGLDPEQHVAADELEGGIAQERAGQEPGLGQHLEAVADAEQGHAALGASGQLAHHR
jgi:hypothetical protein